jgi:hypothetical protein
MFFLRLYNRLEPTGVSGNYREIPPPPHLTLNPFLSPFEQLPVPNPPSLYPALEGHRVPVTFASNPGGRGMLATFRMPEGLVSRHGRHDPDLNHFVQVCVWGGGGGWWWW